MTIYQLLDNVVPRRTPWFLRTLERAVRGEKVVLVLQGQAGVGKSLLLRCVGEAFPELVRVEWDGVAPLPLGPAIVATNVDVALEESLQLVVFRANITTLSGKLDVGEAAAWLKVAGAGAMTTLVQLPVAGPGYTRLTSREYMTWGHPGLISAIQAAAAATAAELGGGDGARIVVKDLNTADGRPAAGHKTHGAGGRNVDLGYFYTGEAGELTNEFINHANLDYRHGPGGRCLRAVHPRWHLEANWVLCRELLKNVKVTQILVDPLYLPLLEARAAAEPGVDLVHAKRVLQFLGNHDNHFHITVVP